MTDNIKSELIRELAELLKETELSEIEYETQGLRLRVARNFSVTGVMPAMSAAAYGYAATPALAAGGENLANHPGVVPSPMVGVTYLSPEPGMPAFVKVGDVVSEGQSLLLIEAMKTFNPIRAPKGGRIAQILVTDGQPVEYGEPLMILE